MATQEPERIGNYRVHPVASIFPPLPDDEYEELKGSIELIGQTYPIIVQGDWLLDGYNRLRACLELEIPPKIQEYRGNEKPEFFIETVNMHRRHLDEGMRASISAKIREWVLSKQNAEKQRAAGAAQSHHGAEGGRGHKKPPRPNSDEGVSKRDYAAENANSTVGQVAEAAQVSRHKAAQAVAVAKHAPELLDEVIAGKMPLPEAAKQAEERKPKKPRCKPKFKLDTAVGRAKRAMAKWIARCPSDSRDDFKTRLLKECRELCRM